MRLVLLLIIVVCFCCACGSDPVVQDGETVPQDQEREESDNEESDNNDANSDDESDDDESSGSESEHDSDLDEDDDDDEMSDDGEADDEKDNESDADQEDDDEQVESNDDDVDDDVDDDGDADSEKEDPVDEDDSESESGDTGVSEDTQSEQETEEESDTGSSDDTEEETEDTGSSDDTEQETVDTASSDDTEVETEDTESEDEPLEESDAETVARVNGYVDSLPWGQQNIESQRDDYVDAVIKTCEEFSPRQDDWDITWCQAHLVAASCKESSLNPDSVVEDSYGGANDPTVGLMQNRFSSTVQDYNSYGPKDSLARIGCDWPDLSGISDWRASGGQYLDFLKDVRCNIAIGAWYYYYNGTGNGDPPCYIAQYCMGQGSAGTLTIGLLSHLNGPENPFDNRDNYLDDIRSWFDQMITPTPSPHPFEVTLNPNPDQYCE